MDNVKYIGMDVHKEAISVAVLNSSGKLVMECTIETKASTMLDFLKGLRGSLHVTFEEGTWAAWLYDLIKPHVTELVVCNPRRNALLKEGSKSDRSDARKLAELLRSNMVCSVYHGENGVRTLRELARSYLTISTDLIRVMTRVKAILRSWGIPCRGKQVYAERYRAEWLGKIQEAGVCRRAEFYYPQFDHFFRCTLLDKLPESFRLDLAGISACYSYSSPLCLESRCIPACKVFLRRAS
jgi:hypothetical protein